jgi:branched-chain amino acid transport system substrate-binding protein
MNKFCMKCSLIGMVWLGCLMIAGQSIALGNEIDPLQADESPIQKIGVLLPLTGDLSEVGHAFEAAVQLAVDEANQAYHDAGSTKHIEAVVRDSGSNFIIALGQLMQLHEEGIRVVVGPVASESCEVLLEYANQNDMLLLTGASTAVSLAIEGDNLMRFVYNDTYQSQAIVDRLIHDDIRYLAIFAQTDIYGFGLLMQVQDLFDQAGGYIFLIQSLRGGNTEDFEFLFSDIGGILEETEDRPTEQTGVLMISYQQGIDLMEASVSRDLMQNYRWYGTDSMAQSHLLLQNESAAQLAVRSRFTCSVIPANENDAFAHVRDIIQTQIGYPPTDFAPIFYDITHIAIQALETASQNEVESVKQAIRTLSAEHIGATGPFLFDAADDRGNEVKYNFWTVFEEDNVPVWKPSGFWTPESSAVQNWMLID